MLSSIPISVLQSEENECIHTVCSLFDVQSMNCEMANVICIRKAISICNFIRRFIQIC